MRSLEKFVSPLSDYYVHTPSRQAEGTLLCPLQTGRFVYEPGYSLRREAFDSFLIMYVESGALEVELEGVERVAVAGSFVYIDCYKLHAYRADSGCVCLWCHFDGPTARGFYEAVTERLGNVFTVPGETEALGKLRMIYGAFSSGGPITEPLLNKYLTDILTVFLMSVPASQARGAELTRAVESVTAYIAEHFAESLTVEDMASRAGMTPFYFIKIFRRETGFTPHDYLLRVRVAAAKYLLKNTDLTSKAICFTCGFSSESAFCCAFKRSTSLSPTEYRSSQ